MKGSLNDSQPDDALSDSKEEEAEDDVEFLRSWNEETMREFSVTETDLNLCCFDGGEGHHAQLGRSETRKHQWCRGPFCFLCIPFSLPVYVSPAFLNALSWALRTAVAAVASTAICIWTPLPKQFTATTLAPIGAIFGTGNTLGRSLHIAWTICCAAVIGASISLGIVSGFRNLELHRLYFGLALFVSSFIVVRPNYNPVAQKLTNVINIVVVLNFAKDPSLDLITPFCYVTLLAIGLACGVLCLILPFPATAQHELAECIGMSLHTAAKLCQCIIWYYNTPPERDIRRLHLKEKTQLLFSVLKDNLAIAKLRLAETSWERFLLCNKGYEKCITSLETMARSLEGMHQSSQLVVNGAVHEHFLTFLKPSFSAVSSSMMIYLDELAHLINKKHGTTREPGEQRLEIGVSHYRRNHRRRRHLKSQRNPQVRQRTRKYENQSNSQESIAYEQQEEEEEERYECDADISKAMELLFEDFNDARKRAFYEDDRVAVRGLDLDQILPLNSFIFNLKYLVQVASDLKPNKLGWYWNWQFITTIYPFHFLVDLKTLLAGLHQQTKISKEKLAEEGVLDMMMLLWKQAYRFFTSNQTIGAIQVAIAISVGSLMVLVPGIENWFDYGVWTPLTVALVMDKKQGLSFRQSMLRLQGTVLGSLVGYVALVISDNKPVGILLFLFGWVLISGYVRSDKTIEYAGTVAAFTAGIVLLSDQQPTTKSVNELALGRIEANFYGIVIIIAMGFVWPLRSANALKRKSIPSIAKKIRDLAGMVFESFITYSVGGLTASGKVREDLQAQAAGLTKVIAAELQLQLVLIDSASQEPQLWRPPFAVDGHKALFASESKLLNDLMRIQQVVISAKKEGKEIYSLLVPALMQSLQKVEIEVLGCLGELLNRIGPTVRPSTLMDEVDEEQIERGAEEEKRFGPLRMHITLEKCKQDLVQVLRKVFLEHLAHHDPDREPVLGIMDVIDLLTFLFNVRQFIEGVRTLWQNVLLLQQTEKLYSRNIYTNSPFCNRLENFLATI